MSLFAKLRRQKEGNRISKRNATHRECAGHHETVSSLESSVWRKPREKHDGLKRRLETLSRLPRRKVQEAAEERLQRGIQPIVIPTLDEIAAAKTRVQYEQGRFHFAVAGVAGSGKSSLINAIRGVENQHQDAAETGVVETTVTTGRYPDPNPDLPFVWYDIPGAGTLHQPDWLYFNVQGLFVFDCVIVLFDNRFTETDIAILMNCRRFQIPTYIVRSKADVHIRNIMYEYGYDSAHDEVPRRESLYRTARERFIADTRANVKRNLKQAELPDQRVYMVSNRTLLSIVRDRSLGFSYKIIDELELIKDILDEACSLRYAASADDDG
ncbi:interferon-inducible GTPase-domain-containing protein [Pisolithus microcarpus]|nr:interferon-inducible GTPase-domain-containing protein [Pisolithus microcarpus]